MKTSICTTLGIEFPVLAFSHCRDVVAAVSKAGGCGMLGAALMTPEELDVELTWIDEQVNGKPYGVDLIVPNSFAGKNRESEMTPGKAEIPEEVTKFVSAILTDHDIDPDSVGEVVMASAESYSDARAAAMIDVALAHGAAVVANALGTPPPIMLEKAHAAGIPVAALVGSRRHATAQLAAGVDILVAQGYEAGGHTGEISTMVLTPEIVAAVRASDRPDVPVLAAGGIVTGSQVAAAVAMGAAGAWCGSVWLTSAEAETAPYTKQKMLEATSADTVRSVHRTGKPSRQLRSTWHDAWESAGAPDVLPMPLQGYVSEPPLIRADTLAASGHPGAQRLSTYWVGQGIGLVSSSKPVKEIMGEMMEDYADAVERINESLG